MAKSAGVTFDMEQHGHGHAVADPGFPVGGRGPRRGAWTPEAATFHKICMSK